MGVSQSATGSLGPETANNQVSGKKGRDEVSYAYMPSSLDLVCTSEFLAVLEKESRVGRFEGLEFVLEDEVR